MEINIKLFRIIGILTLLLGIFSLIMTAVFYFNFGGGVPYETNITLFYLIASIYAIVLGILIILTEKINNFSYIGSILIYVSMVFFMGFVLELGGAESGKYTLSGSFYAQLIMIISGIAFLIGLVIFFIGNYKRE